MEEINLEDYIKRLLENIFQPNSDKRELVNATLIMVLNKYIYLWRCRVLNQ